MTKFTVKMPGTSGSFSTMQEMYPCPGIDSKGSDATWLLSKDTNGPVCVTILIADIILFLSILTILL